MSRNSEVAALLYEIAEILELQEVPFKPRAYQRAAQNLEAAGEDVETLAREDRLKDLPGVGKAIEEKVRQFLAEGRLPYLETLRKEVPAGLLAIMKLPGVGPKKASKLYAALKVDSIEALAEAARQGKVRQVAGFGEKSEQEVLKAIQRHAALPDRVPMPMALEAARELIQALKATGQLGRVEYAGSLRRGRDHVGDVDLLVATGAKQSALVMEAFVGHRRVADVVAHGKTKSSVRLDNGLQIDLRVVAAKHFGAAWLYFTGSKEHNVALRARAQRKGWTLNEYALSRVKDGRPLASATEEEIHQRLGLQWIPPEMRENRGEIERAAEKDLPKLVELGDLKADLHTHTTESDGYATAEQMLSEAARLGYRLYGISDHSAGLGIARGLDGPRFRAQAKALEDLSDRFPKLTVLQGSEVNIRKDGTLDLTAKVRADLDYVIGSVHSAFTLDREEQTRRVLKAVHGGIDILGHPTGRLLGTRPSIELDFEKVAAACAERNVLLEINASPFRLDLWGELIRTAKEVGCRFAIDSDAHTVEGLHVMELGVTQARRGWLSAKEVATTQSPQRIMKHLGHAKGG